MDGVGGGGEFTAAMQRWSIADSILSQTLMVIMRMRHMQGRCLHRRSAQDQRAPTGNESICTWRLGDRWRRDSCECRWMALLEQVCQRNTWQPHTNHLITPVT